VHVSNYSSAYPTNATASLIEVTSCAATLLSRKRTTFHNKKHYVHKNTLDYKILISFQK